MPILARPFALSLSDAYRRQARRLRCRWADDPARLHQSLGDLARRVDAAAANTPDLALPAQALRDPAAARRFAAQVEASLDGGVLRYSLRQRLLQRAQAAGIGRFEANLIIAALQHRHSSPRFLPSQRRTGKGLRWVLIALAMELAFLLIAAWVWLI